MIEFAIPLQSCGEALNVARTIGQHFNVLLPRISHPVAFSERWVTSGISWGCSPPQRACFDNR
jgi:hypothetical protein